jgi:DNA polymerase-1
MGALSGDKQLEIDATATPGIHDKTAVDILGAKCSYKDVKKKFPDIRIAAKAVNFGIPYQMGAIKLATSIRLAGLKCTPAQAQKYIDGWYRKYDKAAEYIKWCKAQVYDPGYAETVYGRRRRFYQLDDDMLMKAQEREACNFPIQSTVGDTLTASLTNLKTLKDLHPEYGFNMVNTVHDAVLFETTIETLPILIDAIIPACMTKGVVIPGINRSLDVDIKLFINWGKSPEQKELEALNVPTKYHKYA